MQQGKERVQRAISPSIFSIKYEEYIFSLTGIEKSYI